MLEKRRPVWLSPVDEAELAERARSASRRILIESGVRPRHDDLWRSIAAPAG
ncbi:hypothetical protein [Mycolicibacterium palauense]|uniref:hypothetical protein n=1 Tax=Mycolicibacterium palauense TaxID=2034511 RepID=UPI00159BACF0|nr:hypothetical protein [Mycolicibacterium palauense]